MSHRGQENQGTGLRDVFDMLVKAPQERLLSLTFQLGESPEENTIHALSLLVLQRETQAMNKLQMLKDNCLAKYLAEKWQMSGGKLEDFATNCGHFQEFPGESLVLLARIFKVLSNQRLCEPYLRNLAYKRALSSYDQKANNCVNLEYNRLREEAKDVCGLEFVEWMSYPTDLNTGSDSDLYGSLGEGNSTLNVAVDQTERANSLPSPLQTSSSMPSYPSHLEISMPTTAPFQDGGSRPETSNSPVLRSRGLHASEATQLKSNEPPMSGAEAVFTARGTSGGFPTSPPNLTLPSSTNAFPPKVPDVNKMHDISGAEEDEEEDKFYAFVIFHALEDADVAQSMREKLEMLIGNEGATFSEDFAMPGKSTLRCVEDAINNTAFTLLLLTRNFNTRLLDIKTDSALINSINKKHKHNTVIPLMPQENCMPKESLPTVLQAIIPLDEKNFERKSKKVLSPAQIEKQRKLWSEEQLVKKQIEKQERLKQSNQQQMRLITESKTAESLEKLARLMAAPLPQQPNIHIENAKYIMIGNDSQMTVDLGGGADRDNAKRE